MEAATIIECSPQHVGSILQIINHAIVHTTSVYDYQARTPEMILAWLNSRRREGYPFIGAMLEGNLVGFGSFGSFRNWPAYKYTVEHSLYVDHRCRRRGIGRLLLKELIDRADRMGFHTLVGVIDSQNHASVALHESEGFVHAGTLREAGFKFGSWRDVLIYQILLKGPIYPVDG